MKIITFILSFFFVFFLSAQNDLDLDIKRMDLDMLRMHP